MLSDVERDDDNHDDSPQERQRLELLACFPLREWLGSRDGQLQLIAERVDGCCVLFRELMGCHLPSTPHHVARARQRARPPRVSRWDQLGGLQTSVSRAGRTRAQPRSIVATSKAATNASGGQERLTPEQWFASQESFQIRDARRYRALSCCTTRRARCR